MNEKEKTGKFNWYLLILLSMAQFMVVLDFSIVNVALPVIQKELHFTQEGLQWIVTAYALTFGGLLLLGGRLADLYGRKVIFLTGLISFSLVSLTGGLSTSQLMLIGSRAVQGIAAALVLPSAMSLITTNFMEHEERQQALSVFGAVGSSGFAAGAVLGGVLTAFLSWRWVLFVNVPIGIITALLSWKAVHEKHEKKHEKLDIYGAITITLGLSLFVLAVTQGGNVGLDFLRVILPGILSFLLIGAFILIEAKTDNPLVPLSIFKIESLTGSNISVLISQAAFAANLLLLAEYLQEVLNYSVLTTGFMFLPMGLIVFTMSSFISPKLMDTFGTKVAIVTGLLLAAAGFFLYINLPAHGTYMQDVFPGMVLIALGFGASFPGLLIASVAGVEKNEQGLASGLINTSRQVGASIGVAILIALVEAQAGVNVASHPAALDRGIQSAMLAALILMSLSVFASYFMIPKLKNEKSEPEKASQYQSSKNKNRLNE